MDVHQSKNRHEPKKLGNIYWTELYCTVCMQMKRTTVRGKATEKRSHATRKMAKPRPEKMMAPFRDWRQKAMTPAKRTAHMIN